MLPRFRRPICRVTPAFQGKPSVFRAVPGRHVAWWVAARVSVFALVAFTSPLAADEPQGEKIDFVRDIRPILEQHCTFCHGASEQQAGFRADAATLLLKGGDRGPAVVPGQPEKSLLMAALTGEGDLLRMPLELDPLDDEAIALIRRWIAQGANVPPNEKIQPAEPKRSSHWAFQPLQTVEPPPTRHADWVRNPIDRFIAARLEAAGLAPSPEAPREVLIRRLSLDLRGKPPTVAEVDAFLADREPGAYERLVRRMLDSPHYGERWGRHWLDLARYADSNGYTIDGPRSIWKYRDWVIEALNADMPFDQFTIEQIAGDMLPDATTSQIVATGFHRNTLINQEGGTDQEQFRVEAVADRVATTGSVYLGLTLECARCHEHKYDPISQREYYQLFAIFNNADEPNLSLPTPQQSQRLSELERQLKAAAAKLKEYDAQAAGRQGDWEAELAQASQPAPWKAMPVREAQSTGGAEFKTLDDGSLLVAGDIPRSDTYVVHLARPGQVVTAIRLEALTHESLPRTGPGTASNGNFVLTDLQVRAVSAGQAERPLPIATAVADHAQGGYPVEHAFDSDREQTGWAINISGGKLNVNRTATFVLGEPLDAAADGLVVELRHGHPNRYNLGRFRLSVTSAPATALVAGKDLIQAAATPAHQRTPEQKKALLEAFRKYDVHRAPLAQQVDSLKAELTQVRKEVVTTMVMRERTQPRESHIHIRGDFLRHGAAVEPAVPAVLHDLPEDVSRPNRLDFARWLVDPANPLTPRVTVNRVWQRYFGRGIVETENDFGIQGAKPSHPELLDWLAGELIRQDWRLKQLHYLIVTSATYRQTSEVTPQQLAADRFNVLLGRQNRLRLEAETIRDAALAASGRLVEKIGGPSVFPPQPAGIYVFTQNNKNWKADEGENRFRRGMYTYFWRSSPDPFLMTFDAPNANVTCTRRVRSNTPLQALTMANDVAFVEIAQGLALRILEECPRQNARERIEHAFRLCLSRHPQGQELSLLLAYYGRSLEAFSADAQAAKAAAPATLPEGTTAAEGAAWTAVARVLLNLDEFINRE